MRFENYRKHTGEETLTVFAWVMLSIRYQKSRTPALHTNIYFLQKNVYHEFVDP